MIVFALDAFFPVGSARFTTGEFARLGRTKQTFVFVALLFSFIRVAYAINLTKRVRILAWTFIGEIASKLKRGMSMGEYHCQEKGKK